MALTDLTRISTSAIATGSTIDAPILRKDVSFRGTQIGVTSALFDSSDNALEFNDNVKLKFGNSGDLSVYHNGTNGLIENATADLKIISTGDDITLSSADDILLQVDTNKAAVNAKGLGEVILYYNAAPKFETTQTGAVVTGILTATGFSGPLSNPSGISTFYDLRVTNNLTVEGTTSTLDTTLIGVDRVEVGANSNSIVGVAITQSGSADILNLFNGSGEQVTVLSSGNVGIGSAVPELDLDVARASSGDNVVKVQNRGSALSLIKYPNVNNSDVRAGSDYGHFAVYTGGDSGSRKLKVEHGGDVKVENGFFAVTDPSEKIGIGLASPTKPLHIYTAGADSEIRLQTNSGTEQNSYISLRHATGDLDLFTVQAGTKMKFFTANTERLQITGTGQFHMGGTPGWTYASQKFVVVEPSNPLGMILQGNNANQGVNLTLQNISNTVNAYSDISFADDGGQIFGAIRGKVVDRDNNHGEIQFHTSSGSLGQKVNALALFPFVPSCVIPRISKAPNVFPVFPVSILSSIAEYVSAAYEVVSPLYKERIDPLEP